MNLVHHKTLTPERWAGLTLAQQLANIGAEVGRSISQRAAGNEEYANLAFERALELFDLSKTVQTRFPALKELARAREVYCDYFAGENAYNSSAESLNRYFLQFNLLARQNH